MRVASIHIVWAAAVAAAGISPGCGARSAGYSVVAESPEAYTADERIAEIDRLDDFVGDRMADLGIARTREAEVAMSIPSAGSIAEPPGVAGSAPGEATKTVPDDLAEEDGASAPGPARALAQESRGGFRPFRSSRRSRCERICDVTEAICTAADRICRIADSLPAHPTASKRCARARNDCEKARAVARTCGCG